MLQKSYSRVGTFSKVIHLQTAVRTTLCTDRNIQERAVSLGGGGGHKPTSPLCPVVCQKMCSSVQYVQITPMFAL